MKSILKTATLLILTAGTATVRAEGPATGKAMPESGNVPSAVADREREDRHLRTMQSHILQMHEMSTKIIAEQDPAKKEALKAQQLQMMKDYRAQMMQEIEKYRKHP